MANEENNTLKYIGIGILVLLAFIAYKLIVPKKLTREDCLKLGSNLRTTLCLQEIEKQNPPEPTPAPIKFSDMNKLALDEIKMDGNTYYEPNPTLNATLRNNSDRPAKDVVVRVRFYKYGEKNSNAPALDTVYVVVSNYIGAGDSQRIKNVVRTNVNTFNSYSWYVDIYYAEEAF